MSRLYISVSRHSQLGPFFGYFPDMFGTPCPATNSTCAQCNAPPETATITTGNFDRLTWIRFIAN